VVVDHGFRGGIAIEPEPVNFGLLRQSIALNGLQNRLCCLNVALSNTVGQSEMELCPVNLGDHRLRLRNEVAADGIYHELSRDVVTVQTTTFDSLVADGSISLDALGVVWIDTQGHEAYVLQGAQKLFETDVPVVVEFWPYALSRAGGLELFESLVCDHYSHFVDTRATQAFGHNALQPVRLLPKLKERYAGPALTDLILLK
jgi:FkbM family methyltransferase